MSSKGIQLQSKNSNPGKAQPPATTEATDTHRAEVYVLAFVYPALKDGAKLNDPSGIATKEIMVIPTSCPDFSGWYNR